MVSVARDAGDLSDDSFIYIHIRTTSEDASISNF